jgi:fibronectin type III domain protein
VATAVVAALVAGVTSPASGLDSTDFTGDVQGPQVVSFTLSPATADVTNAPATLTLTLRITDDLSGVADFPQTNWYSPSEEEHTYGGGLTLASGDRRDGVWSGTMVVPRYAAPGRWRIQLSVPDRVGNWTSFDTDALARHGFPSGFDITDANPDVTPGAVTDVRVAPALVDVRTGQASLQVEVSAADSQSGIKYIVVLLHDRFGGMGGATVPMMTLAAGDARSGRWTGTATIPRYTHQGRWTLEVRTWDGIDNIRTYLGSDLAAAGLTSGFDVSSEEDVEAPGVASFFADPAEVNVHDADQSVRVRLRLTDNLAGVHDIWGNQGSEVQAYAGDPVTGQSTGTGYMPRVSGTTRDGIYEATFTVPRSSATGLRPWSISATDVIGNYRSLERADLLALGALPALLVYNVPLPPGLLGVDPGDGEALVRWDPPVDDRGAEVTGYVVIESPGGARVEVAADARATVITGLANGVTHTFTVVAKNKAGASDPSRTASATPYAGAPDLSTAGGGSGGGTTTGGGDVPAASPVRGERSGYWMLGANGTVHAFGDAIWWGNAAVGVTPAVDLEPTPSRDGYWVADAQGRVYNFGDAPHLGNARVARGETVTSLSATPSGQGYWLFTTRGRVLRFGDAPFQGDMSSTPLNGPVLDSIPTPSGRGYYMVASDGGVFAFGDARYAGSTAHLRLNAPVQSLVPDPDGTGYWLVASDGGIFAFAAPFHGSMGGTRLNRPITGMVGSRTGRGYLMVGEDGGIFTFGDVVFRGSLGDSPPPWPIVAASPL